MPWTGNRTARNMGSLKPCAYTNEYIYQAILACFGSLVLFVTPLSTQGVMKLLPCLSMFLASTQAWKFKHSRAMMCGTGPTISGVGDSACTFLGQSNAIQHVAGDFSKHNTFDPQCDSFSLLFAALSLWTGNGQCSGSPSFRLTRPNHCHVSLLNNRFFYRVNVPGSTLDDEKPSHNATLVGSD